MLTLVQRLTSSWRASPSPLTLSPKGGEGSLPAGQAGVRGSKPGTNLSSGVPGSPKSKLVHLRSVLPSDFVGELRERAEEALNSIYEDYFSRKSFLEFQTGHLGHDSLVMRIVTYRFATNEILSRLVERVAAVLPQTWGDFECFVHPIFYLRFSFPGVFYSEKHRQAFLDSQPHYDRSYGIQAFSFWVPLVDIDEETGGLCTFSLSEIEERFSMTEDGKNRYNFWTYLDAAETLDPLLKQGTVAPETPGGDLLTFDSETLHGATKPKSRLRISFDFRLAPSEEVAQASKETRCLFEEVNRDPDLANAKNLIALGDPIGASRVLRRIGVQRECKELLSLTEALATQPPGQGIFQERARVPWQAEYRWIHDARD